ncbi:ATP-grasp domain-containing protein [Shewanella salipaludis]|uniref:Siderophore biosynthesis protein PvsA n=1 Tax=Shewanella salipaludis TaxID=2723052 RepID=A0A972G0I4_9GAMM|nr:siderophore biosynthesis protein PvsA [Shewanella salipaludis]NMH66077.1 siderophore biosynthesis protein PvsA [Shewanella salipaludis]
MKPVLVLITHVENRAVTQGFVPAAVKLGYEVILVTDHGLAHRQYFSYAASTPDQILEADVFNPLAIIDMLQTRGIEPQLVFSNSDHLQTSTALVAQYFACPGKDWRLCYQAKNKAAMRARLAELMLPNVWSHCWQAEQDLPEAIPFPVVAKPREGVASMDVTLCESHAALLAYGAGRGDACILLEAYLQGPLFTLETLGDGERLQAIGGFDVTLSELPHFVETQAQWNGPICTRFREQALAQVEAFGINFGVCHSEFILTAQGPVLVEINYRSIGDGREFLLDELLPFNWFETILSLHAGAALPALETHTSAALVRYFPALASGHIGQSPEAFVQQSPHGAVRFLPLKQAGDHLSLSHSNKDYLGVLTLIGEDLQGLEASADALGQKLEWELN